MEKRKFIDLFKIFFLKNDEMKIRFDMGGRKKNDERLSQVMDRFKEISNYIFYDKEIWILLVIWDANGDNKKELINSGFNQEKADFYSKGKIEDGLFNKSNFADDAFDDAEIIYLRYNEYSNEAIEPLVYSKAGFELGFENTAGILVYFLSFDKDAILLNLYDDRGMEVLCHNESLVNDLNEKFSDYVL